MAVTARIPLPKQPPHSIEAEQSVLGGVMLRNDLYHEVADKVAPEDFYRRDHQLIFRAIGELVGARKLCDFVTLTEHLRHQGNLDEAGGSSYLGTLAADTYNPANVVHYAEVVRERSVLRALIGVGADIGDMGYQPQGRPVHELIDLAERKVLSIAARRQGTEASSTVALVQRVNARIDRLRKARAEDSAALAGLPTGFVELDNKTQGMEAGDLIILAARPRMGKSAAACNIVENLSVRDGVPTAMFSMEMSGEQLMMRILASNATVPLTKIRSGDLSPTEFDRLTAAQGRVNAAPLFIDETPALSPMELRSRARLLVTKRGVKLVIVDYLQLMQLPNSRETRANIVSEISRGLKALAKELRVPVVALSQLSREVENKSDKRPKLTDLRESGGIEQDADQVWFIHRQEVYEPDDAQYKGRAEFIVEKQRQGPTGRVHVTYAGDYCRFGNPELP